MLHGELASECLARIDHYGLQECRAKFPQTTWEKFFNAPEFVAAAAAHALRFHEQIPPASTCLDLGCGFGYTALCLEILGHKCTAWDAPADILQSVRRYIPVENWILDKIERGKSLNLFGGYELIFLHGVFPMRDAAGWWDWPAYARLVGQLIEVLAPVGLLEIIVNRGSEIPVCCDPAAWSALMDTGAAVDISDNVVTVRRCAPVVL